MRRLWKGLFITSGTQGRPRQVGQSLWTGLYQCAITSVARVAAAAAAILWMIKTLPVRNHGAAAVITATAMLKSVALMAPSQVIIGVWSKCSFQNVYRGMGQSVGFAMDIDVFICFKRTFIDDFRT